LAGASTRTRRQYAVSACRRWTMSRIPPSFCDTASWSWRPATALRPIDRHVGDRDPPDVGEQLHHLGVDHRPRLQHEVARRPLRGNDGKDRIDGQGHRAVSLDGEG
jgi:hypothetical protein